MSEETTSAQTPDESPIPLYVDFHLEVLSGNAQDDPKFALPITLDVSGTVITGELVGRNAWFDELHARLGDQVGGVTRRLSEIGKREVDPDSDGFEADLFIHVRDAHRRSSRGRWGGASCPRSTAGRWGTSRSQRATEANVREPVCSGVRAYGFLRR